MALELSDESPKAVISEQWEGGDLSKIDRLLKLEREKAGKLSEKVAEFVLKSGTKEKSSVWYKREIIDGIGDTLLLQVADVNNHGRNLKAIIKGGNQNDRLETYLRLAHGEGFAVSSTWSLPIKDLTWLRAYPSLASGINWSYEEWYTYFSSPWLGQSKAEILRAYLLYNRYLEGIKAVIDGSQTPKFTINKHFPALVSNNS